MTSNTDRNLLHSMRCVYKGIGLKGVE